VLAGTRLTLADAWDELRQRGVRAGEHNRALAGEGRAAGIACASVVCSIGHDELIAVLLLREQRGHAVQPAPGLWNGRYAPLWPDRRLVAKQKTAAAGAAVIAWQAPGRRPAGEVPPAPPARGGASRRVAAPMILLTLGAITRLPLLAGFTSGRARSRALRGA
jgi:hypothetical protein